MKKNWQTLLQQAITDPQELLQLVELNDAIASISPVVMAQFPLRVPRSFVARMQKGNPHDPLLRQVLPIVDEEIMAEGFSTDPLQESQANTAPGILHKYKNRILLTIVGNCAIHCRYCFRRHFNYEDNTPGLTGLDDIIDYIKANPDIDEVIFSGGDPLLAQDSYLQIWAHAIQDIPHVKILRIHSRIPIVLPERITNEFIHWFSQLSIHPVLAIHCNHPNEINDEVGSALRRMRAAGIHLLNQSVLLKGINDSAATLIRLSQKLFHYGVMPYYLNLLDKTQGTAHFEIHLDQAKAIYEQILSSLPGYLVPKLVREVPALPYKQILSL